MGQLDPRVKWVMGPQKRQMMEGKKNVRCDSRDGGSKEEHETFGHHGPFPRCVQVGRREVPPGNGQFGRYHVRKTMEGGKGSFPWTGTRIPNRNNGRAEEKGIQSRALVHEGKSKEFPRKGARMLNLNTPHNRKSRESDRGETRPKQ